MATSPPISDSGRVAMILIGFALLVVAGAVLGVFIGNTIAAAYEEWQGMALLPH